MYPKADAHIVTEWRNITAAAHPRTETFTTQAL